MVLVISILVAVSGCTTSSNNTNNTTNNNSVQNNTTNSNNTTAVISAEKAKELASEFTGIGVTLGTPTLTTFNGVKVWKVPVYTSGTNESVDSIYINEVTGKRVQ